MIRVSVLVPLVLLVVFGTFSTWVAFTHGQLGFLTLAAREPWGLQVLLDVVISVWLFSMWMVRDARQKGIKAWPYLIACFALGSLGALAYLVHRGLRQPREVVP
jgi:hypothetical protein